MSGTGCASERNHMNALEVAQREAEAAQKAAPPEEIFWIYRDGVAQEFPRSKIQEFIDQDGNDPDIMVQDQSTGWIKASTVAGFTVAPQAIGQVDDGTVDVAKMSEAELVLETLPDSELEALAVLNGVHVAGEAFNRHKSVKALAEKGIKP